MWAKTLAPESPRQIEVDVGVGTGVARDALRAVTAWLAKGLG